MQRSNNENLLDFMHSSQIPLASSGPGNSRRENDLRRYRDLSLIPIKARSVKSQLKVARHCQPLRNSYKRKKKPLAHERLPWFTVVNLPLSVDRCYSSSNNSPSSVSTNRQSDSTKAQQSERRRFRDGLTGRHHEVGLGAAFLGEQEVELIRVADHKGQ